MAIRRTLSLELESGRVLTLKSTDDGLLLSLGKAEATLTSSEVSELHSAIREVAGTGGLAGGSPVIPPVPPSVSRTPIPPPTERDYPLNPQ